MYKTKTSIAILISFIVIGVLVVSVVAQTRGWWVHNSAIQVKFTHNDPWYDAHFGAWFPSGALSCAGQSYVGPGGNGATAPYGGGIANWNWWGTPQTVLLVPKSFLGVPGGSEWVGSNYEANCYYN